DPVLAKMDRAIHNLPPEVEIPLPMTRPQTPESPRQKPQKDSRGTYFLKRDATGWHRHYIEVHVVNAVVFHATAKKNPEEVYCTTLHEIDRLIEERSKRQLDDDEEELRERVQRDLPKTYHDYLDVFSKVSSDILSPH
ncbi:hypothetical protein QBC37DRAFT_250909, partial [Rhypophila decipiens]